MHKPRPVQIGFGSADASSHYSLGVPVGNPPLPHLYWTLFYDYDPVGLAAGVSILDVERNGVPVAADVVTVSLFGEGRDSAG